MRTGIRLGGVAGVVGVLASHVAQAAEPTVLAPSSQWVVDYADNRCRLLRVFGDESRKAVLIFEQGAPGSSFSMTASGPQIDPFRDGREMLLRVGEDGEERETTPFHGSIEDVGPALIYSSLSFDYLLDGDEEDEEESDVAEPGLPSIDPTDAAKVELIAFRQGGRRLQFDTGNMRAPIAALNKCSADLVRAWGLDLDQHVDAMQMPVWSNRDAVARRIIAHYPSEAVVRGAQGIIQMRVMVDAEGTVTDCQLEQMTNAESLKSRACREMKEARFEPALDSTGKPMKSFYSTKIVYKMAR